MTTLPEVDLAVSASDGTRQAFMAAGPEGFARALREQRAVAVTDTTFRDAQQSLLATRVHTRDLLAVAEHVARTTPQLWSLEAWGGATNAATEAFAHEATNTGVTMLRDGGWACPISLQTPRMPPTPPLDGAR